jgi:microcystin-dependent protein
MAWWQWSKTSANNATADATINWQEGQPPASVNDSARQMMARLAEFRDDTSGLLVSGGTVTSGVTTAYTLTSNQILAATPNDGQLIGFTPHAPNGVSPTLRVDGGSTYPIQFASGVAIPVGALATNVPALLKFSLSALAWVLFTNGSAGVQTGCIFQWLTNTAPPGYAMLNGQALPRTGIGAALFALWGTSYGAGDGSTTFNVPDCRDVVFIGQSTMGGTSARGLTPQNTGQGLSAVIGEALHTLGSTELPAHTHTSSASLNEGAGHSHPMGPNMAMVSSGSTWQPGSGPFLAVTSSTGLATTGASVSVSVGSQSGTTGQSHNNVQYSFVTNFIVKL